MVNWCSVWLRIGLLSSKEGWGSEWLEAAEGSWMEVIHTYIHMS